MLRRVAYWTVSVAVLGLLAGCGFNFFHFEQRAAWHDEEEAACNARGEVVASTEIQPLREIRGPGICGLKQPYKVSAINEVGVSPSATLGCVMTAGLQHWLRDSVQPAALSRFGIPVVSIKPLGSYGCRPVDNIPGEKLSEHAYGNAIDVGFFILADGRQISVEKGWRGTSAEQAFLREAFVGACEEFDTVLGPGSDSLHYNHFHLDMKITNGKNGKHYCRPQIAAPPPPREAPPVSLVPPGGIDRSALTSSITRLR